MAATAPDSVEVVATGGFRIEIRPDELTVTPDGTAFAAKPEKSAFGVVLVWLVCICIGGDFLFKIVPEIAEGHYSSLLVLLALVACSVFWLYFGWDDKLHCTRESLEVINISRGKVRRARAFQKTDVMQIQFGAVSFSKYGAINGLIFKAAGRKVKIFSGLKSPEAQKILDELHRLGYDVLRDVGMPMMVEMELERRKSVFNVLS